MAGVLVMIAGRTVGAYEHPRGMIKEIIQMMGPDVFKGLLKSMVEELAKDEEFQKQIVQEVIHEVIRSIGPDGVKDVVNSVASEYEHSTGVQDESASEAGPGSARMTSALVSVPGEFIKNQHSVNFRTPESLATASQALMSVLKEKTGQSSPLKVHPNGERLSAPRSVRRGHVAIIAHPSNPVHTLSVDQVRKLFGGEFSNWAQLGGADLPIKPVVSQEALTALEELFNVPIAAEGVKVPFLSFILVGVAETEGAVGFLLTSDMEQFEFIRSHIAIKKIAIKK